MDDWRSGRKRWREKGRWRKSQSMDNTIVLFSYNHLVHFFNFFPLLIQHFYPIYSNYCPRYCSKISSMFIRVILIIFISWGFFNSGIIDDFIVSSSLSRTFIPRRRRYQLNVEHAISTPFTCSLIHVICPCLFQVIIRSREREGRAMNDNFFSLFQMQLPAREFPN